MGFASHGEITTYTAIKLALVFHQRSLILGCIATSRRFRSAFANNGRTSAVKFTWPLSMPSSDVRSRETDTVTKFSLAENNLAEKEKEDAWYEDSFEPTAFFDVGSFALRMKNRVQKWRKDNNSRISRKNIFLSLHAPLQDSLTLRSWEDFFSYDRKYVVSLYETSYSKSYYLFVLRLSLFSFVGRFYAISPTWFNRNVYKYAW